mmetsp:Transcript_10574/g.11405  ORF Transcript_10574/g.11405 Transcript_10574/m.11405 type:complete len:258 (+) Transcript_10574:198-971(+)
MPYSQEESPASLLSLVHSSQFNSCLKGMNNETLISDSVQCITSFLSKHMTEEHHHSAVDHHSSYHLSNYFEFAVEFVNSIAGLIVLFAVFLACLNLMLVACNTATGLNFSIIDPLHSSHKGHKSNTVLRIRVILGEQIALALALLVASDILDTVLKPSHAYDLLDVVKMGFVTVLRTGLAYFLAKEIKELEEGSSGFRVCGGERNHQLGEIIHETKTSSRRTSDSESEGGTSVKGAVEMGSTLRRTEDSAKLRKRKN